MKNRRAIVGFYQDKGKTKPITKSVSALNSKKVIQKAGRFQGIKPKFFRAIPLLDTKLTRAAPIVVGQRRLFIYMCQESHDSTDAELWYRTMRPAVVIHELKKVDPEVGRMFKIRFDDGYTADANWYELPSATDVVLEPSRVRRTNPPYLGPDFTRFANKQVVEKAAKHYLKKLINCLSAGGLLKPQLTDVEKVKEGHVVAWYPMADEPPVYKRSTEKVLCFAKTPGGAVIGSATGEQGFKGGGRCIVGTNEKPDVDLSDEGHGDFSAVGEVRYYRPVPTKIVGTFKVDKTLLKRVGKAYSPPRYTFVGTTKTGRPIYELDEDAESFPDSDKIAEIRDEINRKMGYPVHKRKRTKMDETVDEQFERQMASLPKPIIRKRRKG